METRRRASVASETPGKSDQPASSSAPRRSTRARTPLLRDETNDKPKSQSDMLSYVVRTPRTRKMSNVSDEATPTRVTRSKKSLVHHEDVAEGRSVLTAQKTPSKGTPCKAIGEANIESDKTPVIKLHRLLDKSLDESVDHELLDSATPKSSKKLSLSASKIRRASEKPTSRKSSKDYSKEEPHSVDSRNIRVTESPVKSIPGSPKTRRTLGKSAIEVRPEPSTDESGDESESTEITSKISEPHPDKTALRVERKARGSPSTLPKEIDEVRLRTCRVSLKPVDEENESQKSNETDDEIVKSSPGVVKKKSKSPDKTSRTAVESSMSPEPVGSPKGQPGSPKSPRKSAQSTPRRSSPEKSNESNSPKTPFRSPKFSQLITKSSGVAISDDEVPDRLIMDVSSEEESIKASNRTESKERKKEIKEPITDPLGSPKPLNMSTTSSVEDLENTMELSSDNETLERSKSKSPRSLGKSIPGSPRTLKALEKSAEMRIGELVMELSSEEESELSKSLEMKENRRSRGELTPENGKPSRKTNGSEPEFSNDHTVSISVDSPGFASPVKQLQDLEALELSTSVNNISTSSEGKSKRKKHRRRKSVSKEVDCPEDDAYPKTIKGDSPKDKNPHDLSGETHNLNADEDLKLELSDHDVSGSRVQAPENHREKMKSKKQERRRSRGNTFVETKLVEDQSSPASPMPARHRKQVERSSEGVRNGDIQLELSDTKMGVPLEVSSTVNKHEAKKKKKKNRPKDNGRKSPEHRENNKVKPKGHSDKTDSEVTVRRKGGGTIIESRPVFSDDAKYVYLNCGWGVRVFSVETGECVRVFDAFSKDFKVVNCFCWNSLPAALTSEGVFIAWDPRSGRVEQKVRMHVSKAEVVVDGFFIPSEDPSLLLCLVIESKDCTNLRVYSGTNFKSLMAHPITGKRVNHPYSQHFLTSGGGSEPFIAYIDQVKGIKILNMKGRKFFQTPQPANKYWTCVRSHPLEDTLAAGDSIGRIVLFRRLSSSRPGHSNSVNSVYHWHTLPVGEIAFTPAGSSMYSGGGELTLVKWNLENPQIRNFLPRLSADIVHISISPYNQMVAVATKDNAVQIVTPTNKLHCVLQLFSWSVMASKNERMFPAGVLYDPRSRGLILNSRPGHLQLYSPHSETLMYNIDVTMMNYLTQERDKVIVNTQVTHTALTSDGLWLATVETRYEPGLYLELRLKFWNYVPVKKSFVLATMIDMPHDDQVHTIKFSPESSKQVANDSITRESEVVLVSTGADRKMRIWSKSSVDSIYRKGETWRCQNACFYRDQPCGPCSFSYDGSVLAVGFGAAVTLWDVENVVLKHSLARSNEQITFVEFGRDECCNILMCATESEVMAWDLLTLRLSWKVELKSAIFIADPYSSFAAVFTVDNQWKILDAHNGKVVYTMSYEGGKPEVDHRPRRQQVLAAAFVPRPTPNSEAPMWMRKSYLYYVDIYQELNCLEPANEIAQLPTFQLAMDKDSGAFTLFGSLVGAKSVREKADEDHAKTVGYGVLGARAVAQLLIPAAHTLPPVNLLCGRFLQSFVILKKDVPDESDVEDKKEDDKSTVVASSDSEQEVEMPTYPTPKPRPKKIQTPAEPMEADVDLAEHFPLLPEDDGEPWRKPVVRTQPDQLFIVDE